MQRGFIQIPILIAIIITVILSGGAFVTYEITRPSQKDSESNIATTIANVQATTTADSSADIEQLKEEIAELKKRSSQPTSPATSIQQKIDVPVQTKVQPSVVVPPPTQNTKVQPTVYPATVVYEGVTLTWCNGGYWKPCNPGKKLYCPASGADATCVPESNVSSQPDLNNAANTKAQSISVLNQILSDFRSLETDETSEINRMESMLNSLIGANDSVSAILIELTTLRRNRLISAQSSLRSYISAVEGIKRTTEGTDVSAFINFNPNQAFADDIKFANDARAAFQTDKASYDDSVRNYLSI